MRRARSLFFEDGDQVRVGWGGPNESFTVISIESAQIEGWGQGWKVELSDGGRMIVKDSAVTAVEFGPDEEGL